MKNLTKIFKKRMNTIFDINRQKSIQLTTYNKRNKCVIEEKITLTPTKNKFYKEFNQWNYLIEVTTKSSHIQTDKTNIKTRLFLTNLDLPFNLDTLKLLRDLIRQHWQVETFHQYKDYNLLEDNNFAYLLQQSCNYNSNIKY